VEQRRPHVLTLVDHLAGGGAERFAVDLVCSLPAGAFDRTICVSRMPRDWLTLPPAAGSGLEIARLREAGVAILPIHREVHFDPWRWGPLLRRLRSVDVLHTHQFGSNCWGTVLGTLARVPVIVAHEQTWSYRGGAIRKLLDGYVIGRLADRFVAVSELDRDRMVQMEKVPAHKVPVIRNAIVPRPPTGRDVRAELGIAAGTPVLVVLARLHPQKALRVMIDALARVCAVRPDATLLIAGGPLEGNPEADRLREQAERLGLGGAVRLLGRRDDVPDVLAAADIGVMSSRYEGTPLAVLDYMEAGLPVVATDVGGVAELVQHDRTGVLVPPGDPAALADALLGLLGDPAERRRLGEAGRARRREEFDYDRTLQRFADLYLELLRGRRHG
jgi:glycosyltransferase involved in cell wall biosynthesis